MPANTRPLARTDLNPPLPILPILTNLQQPLRVIGNHAIESLPNTPLHHILIVDRPRIERTALGAAFANEAGPDARTDEGALEHVERDIGDGEELAGVGDGEADVGDGEGGEVFGAEGEVFGCPDAEDDTFVPQAVGGWADRSDGGGDETHDGVGVVVGLDVEEEPDVLLAWLGEVLEQVSKTGHWLVGGLGRLLFSNVVP